jgi:hypothetical protein
LKLLAISYTECKVCAAKLRVPLVQPTMGSIS